jgi:hypothetical protein
MRVQCLLYSSQTEKNPILQTGFENIRMASGGFGPLHPSRDSRISGAQEGSLASATVMAYSSRKRSLDQPNDRTRTKTRAKTEERTSFFVLAWPPSFKRLAALVANGYVSKYCRIPVLSGSAEQTASCIASVSRAPCLAPKLGLCMLCAHDSNNPQVFKNWYPFRINHPPTIRISSP